MTSRWWRGMNAATTLLFAFAALVQLNDPDPLRWIAIYAAASIACAMSAWRRVHAAFPAIVGAIALAWAVALVPQVVGRVPFASMFAEFEMANVGIERSREMYGLLVVAAWMVVVARKARRDGVTPPP